MTTYAFENFELDVARYELRRDGTPVPMEPQVFEVLAVLVQQAERVVPKDELFAAVWPEGYVSESALTSRIKSVRQALQDDGQQQRLVRTVHGRGYRFVGELTTRDATQPTAAASGEVKADPTPPSIRYTQSADGTRIAYWTLGAGPPLVALPDLPLADTAAGWRLAPMRAWCERLASSVRLIHYDARGHGQSERGVSDLTLSAHAADLSAVLDGAGVTSTALFAPHHAGPIALAFAAAHPDRVSHLILWCSYASGSEPQWVSGIGNLLTHDWHTYSEAIAHALLGWDRPAEARQYAAVVRAAVAQDDLAHYWRAIRHFDAAPLLGQITTPTLVLHRPNIPMLPVEAARRLASAIPHAELVIVEGDCPAVIVDADEPLVHITRFLPPAAPPANRHSPG